MKNNLVRWRADPERVRISVRKTRDVWMATATSLVIEHKSVYAYDADPETAVNDVLLKDKAQDYPGLDLDLQWTYEHPWK